MREQMSKWVVAAALVATLMAAMHGVMSEALFKLVGGEHGGVALFALALALFVLATGLFWERERLHARARGHKSPHCLDWRTLGLTLALFAFTAAAQGVLAFSAAHLVAHWLHDCLALMAMLGALAFCVFTLWLWSVRDKLFIVKAEVNPVERTGAPFHAVITALSTPAVQQDGLDGQDQQAFAAARTLFDQVMQEKGWDQAVSALCRDGQLFGGVPRWNFQIPLRLFAKMAMKEPVAGAERLMVFITSKDSHGRWAQAEALLGHIAQTMPGEPKIEILHASALLNQSGPEAGQFREHEFNANLDLVKRALDVLKARGLEARSIAVDATSGTVEMSIAAAMATINSPAAFIYTNTNDGEVRRFDANASGSWGTD